MAENLHTILVTLKIRTPPKIREEHRDKNHSKLSASENIIAAFTSHATEEDSNYLCQPNTDLSLPGTYPWLTCLFL